MFDLDLNDKMHYEIYVEYSGDFIETKYVYLEDGYVDDFFSVEEWYDWEVEHNGINNWIYDCNESYDEINIVVYYYNALEYDDYACDSYGLFKMDKLNIKENYFEIN